MLRSIKIKDSNLKSPDIIKSIKINPNKPRSIAWLSHKISLHYADIDALFLHARLWLLYLIGIDIFMSSIPIFVIKQTEHIIKAIIYQIPHAGGFKLKRVWVYVKLTDQKLITSRP